MTVEELFRKLSYGELSNLAVAVEATGTIKKDKQNQIIHLANEALKALHTRFVLIEGTQILNTTGLEADTQIAVSTDAIQLRSVVTAWGESLPWSRTPMKGMMYLKGGNLFIPAGDYGSELQVNTQNRHPELLPITTDADLTQEIDLIPELHAALTAHIAYEYYGNMNGADAAAASMKHLNRYATICAGIQNQGILPDEVLPQQKFEERGWI